MTAVTSRRAFGDLTVVVKRYPHSAQGSGPDFVLVHGIGVSSRYFQQAAAALASHGSVYLVDLPGYGSAPNAHRDVSLADHAGVLADFLEDSGFVNPVLVGHSMGAQIVAQLDVDSPEVTDRIVLMAPSLEPRLRTFWRAVGALALDATREPAWGNAITASDLWFRCGPFYAIAQMKHLLADRLEDRLPRVSARALVITGDRDPIVSAQWANQVTDLIPQATLRVVEGGHVMMFSDPVRVADLIAEHASHS